MKDEKKVMIVTRPEDKIIVVKLAHGDLEIHRDTPADVLRSLNNKARIAKWNVQADQKRT